MTPASFTALPPELINHISSSLSNRDIKNLRLVSSICAGIPLHLERIYLSANSLNIQVFRSIADHAIFRYLVKEIVWDDARLIRQPKFTAALSFVDNDAEEPDDMLTENNCPYWFEAACRRSREQLYSSRGRDGPLPHHLKKREQLHSALSVGECWEYYHKLLQDEDRVLESDADINGFKHGLQQFPSLITVTITPAAHGILFAPVYKTPMIRAFPYGFVYPIPRGWPHLEGYNHIPGVFVWNDSGTEYDLQERRNYHGSAEEYRQLWRGYRAIIKALAEEENTMREFIVDTHGIGTGINCYAVTEKCPEYDDFAKICAKKGLHRLDLSLFANGTEHNKFRPFRTGLFFDALASANELEHFHLRTNLQMDVSGELAQLFQEDESMDKHFVPLASVFPVERWSNLQFFGLSQFLVLNSDLISFLGMLPLSVRSIELNFLMFLERDNYRNLVEGIRDQLDWRTRPESYRPNLVVAVPPPRGGRGNNPTRVVWVDEPIQEFLYRDGANPFRTADPGLNYAVYGEGAVERDWFEEAHDRPYDSNAVQRERGYSGYMEW